MVSSLDQDELLNPSSRPASKRRSKTRASDPSRDLDLIVRIDSTLFDQHSPDVPLPSLGLLPPTITRIYNGSTRWLLAQLSAPDLGSASASESPPPSQPLVHLPRLSSHPTQLEEDGDSANSSELDDCGSDNNSDSHLDESHSGETPEELHAPSTLSPTLLAKRTEPPAPTELSPQRHTSPASIPSQDEQAQTILRLQESLKERDVKLAESEEREAVLQAEVDTANEERDCAQEETRESEGAADLWKSRFFDLLSERADDHLRNLEDEPGKKLGIISVKLNAFEAEYDALSADISMDLSSDDVGSSSFPSPHKRRRLSPALPETLHLSPSPLTTISTLDNIATRLSDAQSSLLTWQADYNHLLSSSPPQASPPPVLASSTPPISSSTTRTRLSRPTPIRRTRSFSLTDLTKRVSYVGTRFAWVRDDLQATIASLRDQLASAQAEADLAAAQLAAQQDRDPVAEVGVGTGSVPIEPLLAPYEALFFALEVAEVKLEEGDKEGVERAVKRARERLRAMGGLWEEVERKRGLA